MIADPELALTCFNGGCNCAQAVFSAFSPVYGVEAELARRLASGFGGGLARQGEVCGAVTGAVLTLSLVYGYTKPTEEDAKVLTYQQVQAFMYRFQEQHGSLRCRDLLGAEPGTPEWCAASQARCQVFVRTAAEILNALLEE